MDLSFERLIKYSVEIKSCFIYNSKKKNKKQKKLTICAWKSLKFHVFELILNQRNFCCVWIVIKFLTSGQQTIWQMVIGGVSLPLFFFSFGWLSPLISKLVGEMERLFQAASHQKAWDHFTKAQRKSLESWKKHVMVCYLIFKPIPISVSFSLSNLCFCCFTLHIPPVLPPLICPVRNVSFFGKS